MNKTDLYIFVMALTTFVIRVTPLTLIRGQIKSRFLRSFLYYVPYVTLSVMTFPAIVQCTSSPISGAAALIGGTIASWKGMKMFNVAVLCCVLVFAIELIPGI